MDTTINVIAVLIATLLLAIAIDRGVPNSLDALAYWVDAVVARNRRVTSVWRKESSSTARQH